MSIREKDRKRHTGCSPRDQGLVSKRFKDNNNLRLGLEKKSREF